MAGKNFSKGQKSEQKKGGVKPAPPENTFTKKLFVFEKMDTLCIREDNQTEHSNIGN